MIWIKFLIIIACMELWRQGGNKHSWLRDVLIPIILGVYVGFQTNWWIGLLTIGSLNICRIGYGIPDEKTKDEGSSLAQIFYNTLNIKLSWVVRGTAGLLYGLVGAIFIVLSTGLVGNYLLYSGLNALINGYGEKKQLNVKIFERLIGAGVGSLVLFI